MSLVKFNVTRNSPKWTLNSSGNLQSGSDNLPGFEFNLDSSYKGVFVEEKRTNLILQSEDFSTTWNNAFNRLTITTNATTAPDGTTTADKVEVNTADTIRLNQTFTGLTAGDKYTFSFFAKKFDSDNKTVIVSISDGGENISSRRIIDLDSLSFSSEGSNNYPFTVTTRDYGNGWIRIICVTTIDSVRDGIRVNCLPGSSLSPTSTGANAFFWGAQLEKGDKASSYIKTTTTSVTRNEDVITLTSASQYLPSEGKVTLGWEQREDDTIYIGALSASVASGSRELVYEYSSTEQTLSIDGTEVQTITGQFDFSGMDEIQLGHINGVDQPNTHLKYFAVE